MDYIDLDDNEIIKRISSGDDGAMEYLLKKYGGLVKKEIRAVYIIGAEAEDLTQEGMIGLFKAIKDFEPDKGASFSTFAPLCVRRQDESGTQLGEDIADTKEAANPESLVLAREQKSDLNKKIASELSSFEKKVLHLYLEGLSYADIAVSLSRTEKSVDNALRRIRSKLSKSC